MSEAGTADRPAWMTRLLGSLDGVDERPLSRSLPRPAPDARAASILILFGVGGEGPDVLLLERAHDMRSHAGQVAFPGGSQDPEDDDESAAALREAVEETGLDPSGVDVCAVLAPLGLPHSNFAVTPVVAYWADPSPVYAVDPAETASVHRVPLAELADPANRFLVRHPSGYVGPAFSRAGAVRMGVHRSPGRHAAPARRMGAALGRGAGRGPAARAPTGAARVRANIRCTVTG